MTRSNQATLSQVRAILAPKRVYRGHSVIRVVVQGECWVTTKRRARQVWIALNGPILKLPDQVEKYNRDGLFVCHDCDNTRCVRPKHLWLGTNQENELDAVAKGRQDIGIRARDPELHRRIAATGRRRGSYVRAQRARWNTLRIARGEPPKTDYRKRTHSEAALERYKSADARAKTSAAIAAYWSSPAGLARKRRAA